MDDDEKSATSVLSDFLREARGPPTEIAEFEVTRPEPSRKVTSQVEATAAERHSESTADSEDILQARMRVAALVAVLSISGASPASRANAGRRLGSSWAEDHRRRRMGLIGLSSRRSQRARWR